MKLKQFTLLLCALCLPLYATSGDICEGKGVPDIPVIDSLSFADKLSTTLASTSYTSYTLSEIEIDSVAKIVCGEVSFYDTVKFEPNIFKEKVLKYAGPILDKDPKYKSIKGPAKLIKMFEEFKEKLTCDGYNQATGKKEKGHVFKRAANLAILDFFRNYLFTEEHYTEDEDMNITNFKFDLNIIDIVDGKAETFLDYILRLEAEGAYGPTQFKSLKEDIIGFGGKRCKDLLSSERPKGAKC